MGCTMCSCVGLSLSADTFHCGVWAQQGTQPTQDCGMHPVPRTIDTSLLPVLQGVAHKWTETKQHVKQAGDEAVMAHMKACTAEQLLSTACELEERAAKARRQAAKVI